MLALCRIGGATRRMALKCGFTSTLHSLPLAGILTRAILSQQLITQAAIPSDDKGWRHFYCSSTGYTARRRSSDLPHKRRPVVDYSVRACVLLSPGGSSGCVSGAGSSAGGASAPVIGAGGCSIAGGTMASGTTLRLAACFF